MLLSLLWLVFFILILSQKYTKLYLGVTSDRDKKRDKKLKLVARGNKLKYFG